MQARTPILTPTLTHWNAEGVPHPTRSLNNAKKLEIALRRRAHLEVEGLSDLVAYFGKRLTGWEVTAVESYVKRGFSQLAALPLSSGSSNWGFVDCIG